MWARPNPSPTMPTVCFFRAMRDRSFRPADSLPRRIGLESPHPTADPEEGPMKAVAAVAEILKREGTTFLIGYPVNPIIEAAAQADIRTIIVRQERTGLHMADAVSRITSGQKIGVFCMQQGP